jgi:hypothetical protein
MAAPQQRAIPQQYRRRAAARMYKRVAGVNKRGRRDYYLRPPSPFGVCPCLHFQANRYPIVFLGVAAVWREIGFGGTNQENHPATESWFLSELRRVGMNTFEGLPRERI